MKNSIGGGPLPIRIPEEEASSGLPVVSQFYYSHTFPYLIRLEHDEILRQLRDVPAALRLRELVPHLAALGETSGDPAWQVLRTYLDKIEAAIAEIVQRHSPSYWFHLHRRLRPMLANVHEGKTDDTTVALVRRIAELAYAKHGDLGKVDDLGPIMKTRLETFLDGAWYEATAIALNSRLKAKKLYQKLKYTEQVVLSKFQAADLCAVFGIEGLCYEYWWASAAMRTIGKGALAKWDNDRGLLYNDAGVNPICFDYYDQRNAERSGGFEIRLGTWIDRLKEPEKMNATEGEQIHFAQLRPNPTPTEYLAWIQETRTIGRGYGATNFEIGTFSLVTFKAENGFMAEPFAKKHGIEMDAVLFAVWAASFFGIYTGVTTPRLGREQQIYRTFLNWSNLHFRGYTMVNFNQEEFAREAIWWAKLLKHKYIPSDEEARRAFAFLSLGEVGQRNIGLWSGGKRPIFIPSMHGLMIDLAAIMPFLQTLFFGVPKVQQIGGRSFENSVRAALRQRGLEVCLQGPLRWSKGDPREVDAAVRIEDRLILIECVSYELPIDYDVGKPSVFENRKKFIQQKIDQARTLAERVRDEPKGTNFDVAWAKSVDWRVVSPFVEFAWHVNDPLIDQEGLPRTLQIGELLENLTKGTLPAESLVPLVKKLRGHEFKGTWY